MSFKEWMYILGYERKGHVWFKNDVFVRGKELSDLLNEYNEYIKK